MTALKRAIAICGNQSELARRVKGKPATGHVYYWIKNGVNEEDAVAIENAVAAAIAEDEAAAQRANNLGGAVTAEELRPDLEWTRGPDGAVLSFTKRIERSEPDSARRPAATAEDAAAAPTPTIPMSEAA